MVGEYMLKITVKNDVPRISIIIVEICYCLY